MTSSYYQGVPGAVVRHRHGPHLQEYAVAYVNASTIANQWRHMGSFRTFVKVSSTTRLRVTLSAACWARNFGKLEYGVEYRDVSWNKIGHYFFNTTGDHRGFGGTIFLSSIPAGPGEFRPIWSTQGLGLAVDFDFNDTLTMTIEEVP